MNSLYEITISLDGKPLGTLPQESLSSVDQKTGGISDRIGVEVVCVESNSSLEGRVSVNPENSTESIRVLQRTVGVSEIIPEDGNLTQNPSADSFNYSIISCTSRESSLSASSGPGSSDLGRSGVASGLSRRHVSFQMNDEESDSLVKKQELDDKSGVSLQGSDNDDSLVEKQAQDHMVEKFSPESDKSSSIGDLPAVNFCCNCTVS